MISQPESHLVISAIYLFPSLCSSSNLDARIKLAYVDHRLWTARGATFQRVYKGYHLGVILCPLKRSIHISRARIRIAKLVFRDIHRESRGRRMSLSILFFPTSLAVYPLSGHRDFLRMKKSKSAWKSDGCLFPSNKTGGDGTLTR